MPMSGKQLAAYNKAVAEANEADENGDKAAYEEALRRAGDALDGPMMGR